jgi:hypothetical protein
VGIGKVVAARRVVGEAHHCFFVPMIMLTMVELRDWVPAHLEAVAAR